MPSLSILGSRPIVKKKIGSDQDNSDKYEQLQFGESNQNRAFPVNGGIMGSFVEQNDLGVQDRHSYKCFCR